MAERPPAGRDMAGPVPAQGRAAGMGRAPRGTARRAAGGHGRLMPLRELHRQVAAIALRAAARHGFALGGGNALIAYGVISRPTQDVDLVTNRETGAGAAARQDRTSELAGLFPGLGDELAEWQVTAPDGQRTDLQLTYFDRGHDPVLMEVGPVLDLEDVAGSKVCALAGRAYSRDYV